MTLPEDLQSEQGRVLQLFADECAALNKVRALLSKDRRFEYLSENALRDATVRFVCEADRRRKGDLVARFVQQHARDLVTRTCFLPLELLVVSDKVDLFGITLIPAHRVDIPATVLGPDPRPTMASVVAVGCSGTDYEKMGNRARAVAEHALRLLRVALREDRWIDDRQLRFRLGSTIWFEDTASGWKSRPDEGWELELGNELIQLSASQEIAQLPPVATNDVERRADLALRWFERAQLEFDPMAGLLYLFYALEAILGEKSAAQKAASLAIRRAMLGLLVSGGFSHPARTFLLYDRVRSAAVHGEEPPEISEKAVDAFAFDVRRSINEFLAYARREGFTRRKQVREALDTHERRKRVVQSLLSQDPELWSKHL